VLNARETTNAARVPSCYGFARESISYPGASVPPISEHPPVVPRRAAPPDRVPVEIAQLALLFPVDERPAQARDGGVADLEYAPDPLQRRARAQLGPVHKQVDQ
jgi:hypothetical protein